MRTILRRVKNLEEQTGVNKEIIFIFEKDFGVPATHFITDMVHRQFSARFHLLADQRRRRCQRGDESNCEVFGIYR